MSGLNSNGDYYFNINGNGNPANKDFRVFANTFPTTRFGLGKTTDDGSTGFQDSVSTVFYASVAMPRLARPASNLAPKLGALVEDTTNGTIYRQGYQAIDTTGIVDGAFVQWNAAAGNFKVQSNTGFGTVTQVTAPSGLSPLFTTSVATNTTTPVITFGLTNAAAHKFWGNFTGSTGAPSYSTPILASADFPNQGTTVTVLHGNAAGNPSWGSVNLNTDVTGTLMAAQFPALSGQITTPGGSLTTTIAAGTVTNTQLAGSIDLTTKVTGIGSPANGFTGVNNGAKTITLGGNLTTSGAFASTFTMTGTTAVTFPTSGTLLTTTGSGASLTSIPLTITGTANQIIASSSTGNITLSTPQNIAPGSSPTFTGLNLTGLAAGSTSDDIVTVNGSNVVRRTPWSTINQNIANTNLVLTAGRTLGGGTNSLEIGTVSSPLSSFRMETFGLIGLHGMLKYESSSNPTDANYTATANTMKYNLPVITANRTLTLPNPGSGDGDAELWLWNKNTSAFSWLLSPSIKDASGNTITALSNQSFYDLVYDDASSTWIVKTVASANSAATSGSYTPSVVNLGAFSAATPNIAYYQRIGNYVTVQGSISLTGTGAGNGGITVSLPIASTISSTADVVGSGIYDKGLSGGSPNNRVFDQAVIIGDSFQPGFNIRTNVYNGGGTMYYSFIYKID